MYVFKSSADFFSSKFTKKTNRIRVSNSLDLNQAQYFVGPGLGPDSVCNDCEQMTLAGIRVKIHVRPYTVLYHDFTVKPVLSGHSKRRQKIGFQGQLLLNAGQKYCRMLQESILQYFRPSLSYHLSLRPLFVYF